MGKTMEILETVKLVKIGMQFCDERMLPLIISYVEPKEDPVIRPPLFTVGKVKNALRKPNTVVTFMEANRVIGDYQIIFFLILYCGIPLFGLLGYVVSNILEFIDSLTKLSNWVETTTYSILIVAFIAFWAGVLISIKRRTKVWEEARDNELEIQKLEYFALNKSSKIMAKILVEIEKLKDEREEEMGRVNKIRKKRSVLDAETMKMFNAMLDEREKEIRRKGNIKALLFSGLSWFVGMSMTYAFEKTYDYWLFGTTPTLGGTNK